MKAIDYEKDIIEQGFEKIDPELIDKRPPKINWGQGYLNMAIMDKLAYLEKLAATMNQAAAKIQVERDHLGQLCEKKEEHIISLKKALDQNNSMIQAEVTKANADRQELFAKIAELNQEIRGLKGDGHC